MTVTDFGWEDALHTVRAGRSCANPNLGFQRQLQEFEKHEVHQVMIVRGLLWWGSRPWEDASVFLYTPRSMEVEVGEAPRGYRVQGHLSYITHWRPHWSLCTSCSHRTLPFTIFLGHKLAAFLFLWGKCCFLGSACFHLSGQNLEEAVISPSCYCLANHRALVAQCPFISQLMCGKTCTVK